MATKTNKFILFALLPVCSSVLIMEMQTSQAEFTLNFQPHSGSGDLGDGGRGGWGGGGSRGGRGQDWEFHDEDILQEMVSENGQEYYHVIIKDDYQDFKMDFYIKTASPNGFYDSSGGGRGGRGNDNTGPASSSYGNGGPNLQDFEDPFQKQAGTGTGNPNRVYMRMILRDSDINQEFFKAKLDKKPIITQTVVDNNFRDEVVVDMSNSNYSQNDIAGNVDIHTVITDSKFPGGISDFDLSRDGGQMDVTAGRFTYAPGSGPGESNGTYTYVDGGFDVLKVDWLSFCDPDQNPRHDCRFDGSSRGGRGGRGGGWGGGW